MGYHNDLRQLPSDDFGGPGLPIPTNIDEDGLVRECFTLSDEEAGKTVRQWFKLYPVSSYWTRVESWKKLDDGRIEFTMVRLPSAE